MIDSLTKDLILLSNKLKYIKENLDGTIDLRRKKKDEVNVLLKSKGYDIIDEDIDFKYLTKLPMDSVTDENVVKLEKEHGDKVVELEKVKVKSIQQLWLEELGILEIEYIKYKEERERTMQGSTKEKSKQKSVVKKIKLLES